MLIVLAMVAAASFDCAKAATTVERTICASPELSALDVRLADAFTALQDSALFGSETAELMEQRLWLQRRAERCPGNADLTACLAGLYRTRLTELLDAARTPSGTRLTSSTRDAEYPDASPQDLEVCRTVAAAVEQDSLNPPKSSPFLTGATWRTGAADVGLGTDDEGTMHGSNPLVATRGATTTLNGQFSKPEESNPWAMTARWFFHAGRPYIVRYPDWGDRYPEYVGALTEGLVERPLCRLKVKVDVQFVPARRADAGLCRTAWNGGGRKIAPVKFAVVPDVHGRDSAVGRTDIDASVVVDAMNDGHPLRMYHYIFESEAGAGCELSYYDTQQDDTSSAAHRAWRRAQGVDPSVANAGRTCDDDTPIWLRIGGKTYLFSQSVGARSPTWSQQEFATLDTIEHGEPRRVCQADYSRRTVMITDI